MSEQELKECPFCGNAPEQINSNCVRCANDFCSALYLHPIDIESWNRRAPSPREVELEQRIQLLIENLEKLTTGQWADTDWENGRRGAFKLILDSLTTTYFPEIKSRLKITPQDSNEK